LNPTILQPSPKNRKGDKDAKVATEPHSVIRRIK
jgi:hypothetical protein